MARFGDSHLSSGMAAGPRCPPPPQSGRAVLPMGSWLGEREPCWAWFLPSHPGGLGQAGVFLGKRS